MRHADELQPENDARRSAPRRNVAQTDGARRHHLRTATPPRSRGFFFARTTPSALRRGPRGALPRGLHLALGKEMERTGLMPSVSNAGALAFRVGAESEPQALRYYSERMLSIEVVDDAILASRYGRYLRKRRRRLRLRFNLGPHAQRSSSSWIRSSRPTHRSAGIGN